MPWNVFDGLYMYFNFLLLTYMHFVFTIYDIV